MRPKNDNKWVPVTSYMPPKIARDISRLAKVHRRSISAEVCVAVESHITTSIVELLEK